MAGWLAGYEERRGEEGSAGEMEMEADSFSVVSLIKLEVTKEPCIALNREPPNTPATPNM